jgi:indolepyruvate ferredoxin oxidoreductase beta subunit
VKRVRVKGNTLARDSEMNRSYNFLLAGVGGQGTILASNVLAEVGLAAGFDVKKSEVHGMSQRGGSVNTHVRWDAKHVYSPLIGLGEADLLLIFEEAEALRYAEFLRAGGVAVVNQHTIMPITVSSGSAHYPTEEEVRAVFRALTREFYLVPGTVLAQELGEGRAANVVLLGAVSSFLEVPAEAWLAVIEALVPPRHRELNRQAFIRGSKSVRR